MLDNLQQFSQVVSEYRANKKWYRYFVRRSAVALIVREGREGLEVLMIKRAERQGDPWSGHMAFPGGRLDAVDNNSLAAAMRETHEEVGLADVGYSQCLGRLSDITSRSHNGLKPMVVSAYIFSLEGDPTFALSEEVADTFWIPLTFLADRSNRQSMEWTMKKLTVTLPCYFYQQQRIWGLSLMMLDELLSVPEKLTKH